MIKLQPSEFLGLILEKGRKEAEGTIKTWGGIKYQKTNGKWHKVKKRTTSTSEGRGLNPRLYKMSWADKKSKDKMFKYFSNKKLLDDFIWKHKDHLPSNYKVEKDTVSKEKESKKGDIDLPNHLQQAYAQFHNSSDNGKENESEPLTYRGLEYRMLSTKKGDEYIVADNIKDVEGEEIDKKLSAGTNSWAIPKSNKEFKNLLDKIVTYKKKSKMYDFEKEIRKVYKDVTELFEEENPGEGLSSNEIIDMVQNSMSQKVSNSKLRKIIDKLISEDVKK